MSSLPNVEGAIWTMSPVKKDGIDLGDVPILTVEDVAIFNEAFPGLALAAVNGTSIRVSCQRVGRDMRWESRAVTAEEIAERILLWAKGVRVSTPSVSSVSDEALLEELRKRNLI